MNFGEQMGEIELKCLEAASRAYTCFDGSDFAARHGWVEVDIFEAPKCAAVLTIGRGICICQRAPGHSGTHRSDTREWK